MSDQAVLRLRFDACQFLYLKHLSKGPGEMDLRLTIVEARLQPQPEPGTPRPRWTPPVMPIATLAGYDRFEVIFKDVLAYGVRDQGFALAEAGEAAQEGHLKAHQSSTFLAYIDESMLRTGMERDALVHFSVTCLAHVVDVACTEPPLFALSEVRDPPPRTPI